jgi:hypothetical protein
MTETRSFVHELLLSVYQRLGFAVASILRRYRRSKRNVNSKNSSTTKEITSQHAFISKSTLGTRISDVEQLAEEANVDILTVWQAALALTLHFYNPSEALSFAYDNSAMLFPAGSDNESNLCSLRVEPAETTIDLLQRLRDSTDMKGHASPTSQITWKRIGDNDAPTCKAGIQIHNYNTKQSIPNWNQQVCAT